MKKQILAMALTLLSTGTYALECGDSLSADTVMEQDLDCSNYEGFAALSLSGDMILNGNGHKIISPNTYAGLYTETGKVKVKNLEIAGKADGVGIMSYNTRKLVVKNVTATDMFIGVDYNVSEDFDCDRVKIKGSNLSSNEYGVRISSPLCSFAPNILDSDFSFSKSYALNITANKIRINGLKSNTFDNSSNGLLLSGSEKVVVKNLDLSESGIDGTQVFSYSSGLVRIKDSKFGNNSYEGIHIYDAQKVVIRRVEAHNSGVGIKVVNENVATEFLGRKIASSGNETAGLLIDSSTSVKFSSITFDESVNNVVEAYILNQL